MEESGNSSGEWDSEAGDYWNMPNMPNWLDPATTAEGVVERTRCRGLEREGSVRDYRNIVEVLNEELGLGVEDEGDTPAVEEDCTPSASPAPPSSREATARCTTSRARSST